MSVEEHSLDDLDIGKPEDWEPDEEPSRPKLTSTQESRLRKRIQDPISKIASWVGNRDPELGEILREDGPKMATLLSKVAANSATPAGVVLGIQVFASLLEPLDAFGRTIVHLFRRAAESRARRIVEEEPEPQSLDANLEPEPEQTPDDGVARPWEIG